MVEPVNEQALMAMAERVLTNEARLDILETAFINLVSTLDIETARAMETVFREIGEEQLMIADEGDQAARQHRAAVRLGKRIEAALAKRGGV